jgi:ATP-dependent DNA helicase RecG
MTRSSPQNSPNSGPQPKDRGNDSGGVYDRGMTTGPATKALRPSAPAGGVGLDTALSAVVEPAVARSLHKAFGMETVSDLLSHYPRRYARRGELTVLSELPLGEDVTLVAEVLSASTRSMQTRKGSMREAKISDGTAILSLTFFNGWQGKDLEPGVRAIFAGKVTAYKNTMQLAHPAYKVLNPWSPEARLDASTDEPGAADAWAQKPIPIYPATGSFSSWDLPKAVTTVLDSLAASADSVPDPLPAELRRARGLLAHRQALEWIHRPTVDEEWHAARDTLRFTEAYVLQSALLLQRAAARAQPATPRVPAPGGYLERFDAALPFTLTGEQQSVGAEIARDLSNPWPMNRLVQGEVGSGKTIVALRAMLAVADSGGQAALLAPTEVLAGQHLRSIVHILGPDLAAELMPTLLTGSLGMAERRKATLRTVSGQARIVIGTHALLGEKVGFFDLGLVVVDEQHRFGVDQREALRLKGAAPPHVLVLTATPIPRTVAMTVFGDLDVSTITELPAGRAGISSFVVPPGERPAWATRVWTRLAEELALGRQAFVVCPAIAPKQAEEGDDAADQMDADQTDAAAGSPTRLTASVESVITMLRSNAALGSARIEALHGRMSGDEKDEIMRDFAAGRIDVLVATTVIEVGVDVPNASAMVVMDADRFGVSQLHQLRGRVGRGSVPGLCLLVTYADPGSLARERVEAVAATLDGFELAQADLELRREGDVLGSNQSGARSSLRLLRVARDGDLIAAARDAALQLTAADPRLELHAALRSAVQRRLGDADLAWLTKS